MEKRKLKKLRINRIKDEFPMIGESEQLQLKGGEDPIYNGGMLPEVTVYGYGNLLPEATAYGNGDAHWDAYGKHDVEGCGCGTFNSNQSGAENNVWNYWTHRLFHRGVYY